MNTNKADDNLRKVKRALKLQAEADNRIKAEFEAAKVEKEFRDGLPKRLIDAQALAGSIGIHVSVVLLNGTPSIKFYDIWGDGCDHEYTYESESWEVNSLEGKLSELSEAVNLQKERRIIAKAIYDKLTDHEKYALKEHINYL